MFSTELVLTKYGKILSLIMLLEHVFSFASFVIPMSCLIIGPLTFEQRSVIRYGVIGAIHRGDARHYGELPGL